MNESRSTFGGRRELLAMVVLFVLLTSIGPTARPMFLLIATSFAVWWYFRTAFRFGKRVGIAATVLFSLVCATGIGIQYSAYRKNVQLEEQLSSYNTVQIQRWSVWPTSAIYQVSFEDNVSDQDIAAVCKIPELRTVSHVFIENCRATDLSLDTIATFDQLSYICIESDIISDEAITEFEQLYPNCTVIPPNRN